MDYVKIPQNVRVEDKLIGPLSLRQIIIIAFGVGISYALFAGIQKSQGAVPPVLHGVIWWPAILCIAFAVVKINDISLIRYALLILEMFSKPRIRVWQPRKGIDCIERMQSKKNKKRSKEESVQEHGHSRSDVHLEDLSVILDRENRVTPVH